MDKNQLLAHLGAIDRQLQQPAILCIYGSGACILMDEPDRTSLDIDVAAPYSHAEYPDLEQAAEAAGLPINPDEHYAGDHIEWISALRLCLPRPNPETEIVLWQGRKLTIKTVAVGQLIASKLIRYDQIDQSDIQYLCMQSQLSFTAIEEGVGELPPPFDQDLVVLDNLACLKTDLQLWREAPA